MDNVDTAPAAASPDSRNERLVILREEDVGGRERVTADEEQVARAG